MRRRDAAKVPTRGVTIIGPGRLGQAMGKALRGASVPVDAIAGRNLRRARRAAGFIGGGHAVRLSDSEIGSGAVIVLTVSDSVVRTVARALARQREDWSGRVVLHTCGSLGLAVLEPFRQRGAAVGSLHPFQTIPSPSAGARSLRGCYWSVDGDRKARALAEDWVKRLGGKSFRIPADRKALYHLSAFLVCPTTVTLMDQSERLLRRAGVPARMIRPMLSQFVTETARNFADWGGKKALTGPVPRGDWETLERHVAMLRRYSPELIPVHRELVRLMLRLAGNRTNLRGKRASAKWPLRGKVRKARRGPARSAILTTA